MGVTPQGKGKMADSTAAAGSATVEGFVMRTIRTNQQAATQAITKKLRGRRVLLERRFQKRQAQSTARHPGHTPARRHTKVHASLDGITFEQLTQQHEIWLVYAKASLSMVTAQDLAQTLLQLDRHGARVRVVRSRCPAHVSAQGIVLLETHSTFVLSHEGGQMRIPKRHTVFEMELPTGCSVPCVLLEGDKLVQHAV
jgi:RNase P/RNase MRP subunit p29